jgi:CRP-like cAMP-binding protein
MVDGTFGIARRSALLRHACRPALQGAGATALARVMTPRRFAAGDTVLTRGKTAHSAWLVVAGSVAQGVRAAAGFRQRRQVGPGQWLDLHGALLGVPHAEDAVSDSDSLLLELPRKALLGRDPEQPRMLRALVVVLAAELLHFHEAVRGLTTKDVRARVATWLLQQAYRTRDVEVRSSLRLQQRKRDIAAQLGTTAESFSRALTQLEESGLIDVHGASIVLLDLPALQRLAEPGAAV